MKRSAALGLALVACQPTLEGPAPRVDAVDPPLLCHEQRESTLTLTGAGFTPTEIHALNDDASLAMPGVSLQISADLFGGARSGEALSVPREGLRWIDAGTLELTVAPELGWLDGVYGITLSNPDGQASGLDGAVAAVPAPALHAVDPPLVCNSQVDTTLTLSGDAFLTVDGALPTVSVGDWSAAATASDGCQELAGPVDGASCTQLTVVVPAGSLPTGALPVSVGNPAPADCATTEAVDLTVVAAPVITGFSPESVCTDAGQTELTVLGEGFLTLAGLTPEVTLDGEALTVLGLDACVAVDGVDGAMLCGAVTVELTADRYALGAHTVEVTNPAPADCVSAPATLEIAAPPTITDIEPDSVCDSGGSFTILGTGFSPDATVSIDDTPAASVEWVDEGTLVVTVAEGLETGPHTVTVSQGGCAVSLSAGIEVVVAPLLFYVDPPVVYSGIPVEATLYIAGLTGALTDVWLAGSDGAVVAALDFTWDAADPDTALAVVPAGLPDGAYDVWILQDGSCPSSLSLGVEVSSDLSVAVEAVDPPFAWASGNTAVEITATDPAPAGEVQFQDVPRVYLNPESSGGVGAASALRSVDWEDPTLLRAVIPSGLEPGVYDVVVVNPDGTIGFLAAGLEITADPPPTITAVAPVSVDTSSDEEITVQGADFRDPAVSLSCYDPETGTTSAATATVDSASATEIVATVPSTTLSSGLVCVVRVTNSDDTTADYAAISVTNPSSNLFGWRPGPDLLTARRAPAAASGRATATSRFVYAIGGDSGSTSGALASIEAASVDLYGAMGDWAELPGALPEPRTLAGLARVGRFLYLVGGDDGGGAVATVWRAEVLDPLEVPVFDDLSVDYGDGVGLGGGTWIYRVSALFAPDDPRNPGGESLPSDPIVVRLPELDQRIQLTLTWTAVEDAVGYRIYRTPSADSGSGTEEWLADVSGAATLVYDDLGDATDASQTPLPLGALGAWAELDALSSPRAGACVAVAEDPDDDTVRYLYAAGGYDASGDEQDDIEILSVILDDEHHQSTGGWEASARTLPDPVWACGAWTVDDTLNTVVDPGESWVYFGGGEKSSGTSGEVRGGLVGAGGELTSWTAVDDMSPTRAGFGAAGASDYLYAFGGQKGRAHAGGVSAELLSPPTLDNWNSLGISMSEDRYLMGCAQESAVIFVLGGDNGSGAATRSTDYTNN